MDHSVAIRAKRPEVSDGIYPILSISRRERLEMMDMDELCSEWAINLFEIKSAGNTLISIFINAPLSSCRISLIRIYHHSPDGPFSIPIDIL